MMDQSKTIIVAFIEWLMSSRVHQGPPGSLPSDRHWSASCRAESSKASWKARTLAPSSWICYGQLNEFRQFVHFNVQLTKFMAFHGNSTCVMMIIMPNLLCWRCWSAMNWEVQQHPCSVEAHRVLCPFDAVPAAVHAGAVQGLCRGCVAPSDSSPSLATQIWNLGIIGIPMCHSVILFLLFLINLSLLRWWVNDFREIAQRLDMTSIQGQCMLAVLTTIVDRVRGHICWCFCYIATFHLHFICISFAFH